MTGFDPDHHHVEPNGVGATLRCPGDLTHLPAIKEAQERIDALVADDFAVIPQAEYDHLYEHRGAVAAAATLEDVQKIVFPLPDLGEPSADTAGALSLDELGHARETLAGYEDDALRTSIVLPGAEYRKLLKGVYPEMMEAQAGQPPYPALDWLPSPNYTAYNQTADNSYYVVEHTGEGSFSAVVNWLRDRRSNASCEVVIDVNASRRLAQLVSTKNISWTNAHAHFGKYSASNQEREGYANRTVYPDAHYRATAQWDAYICYKYKIPVQLGGRPGVKGSAYRAGIFGHNEVPWPSTHTDPGRLFDWEKLLSYIRRALRGERLWR
jgi:N-acetyl-anhydromuramyl-L-alanine amidase AmpD